MVTLVDMVCLDSVHSKCTLINIFCRYLRPGDSCVSDTSIVHMHKLVKCKNANQHIAHSHALVFVQLHECTVIRLKTRKTPLTFAIGDGINKSQGFTNAPFKGSEQNMLCKCKTKKKRYNEIKKEENDS